MLLQISGKMVKNNLTEKIMKVILRFISAFLVLLLVGWLLDLFYTSLGEINDVFNIAYNLLKLLSPGASDSLKLILDFVYSLLYALLPLFSTKIHHQRLSILGN
jgi:hypothetical protein